MILVLGAALRRFGLDFRCFLRFRVCFLFEAPPTPETIAAVGNRSVEEDSTPPKPDSDALITTAHDQRMIHKWQIYTK